MIKCPNEFLFSSGAWGCVYYIGCLRGMEEKWGTELSNKTFYGISAGSLIALTAVLKIKSEVIYKLYNEMAFSAKHDGVIRKMQIYHNRVIDELLKNEDAYKKACGKLKVGVTKFFNRFEWIDSWKSNADLRNTLHASMHIPFYSTYKPVIKQEKCLDGAFSLNLKKLLTSNRNILIISLEPYYSHLWFKPGILFSDKLSPCSHERQKYIYNHGYEGLLNWSGHYHYTPKRATIYNYITWFMTQIMWWTLRISRMY